MGEAYSFSATADSMGMVGEVLVLFSGDLGSLVDFFFLPVQGDRRKV